MERVKFTIRVDEKDFGIANLEDPKYYLMKMQLTARGKTFKEEIPYAKGRWTPEEFRNTDQELIGKFMDNASGVLPEDRVRGGAGEAVDRLGERAD